MTKEQVIHDLRVLAEYFAEQSDGCMPLCLVEAIKIIEEAKNGSDSKSVQAANGTKKDNCRESNIFN